MKVDSLAVAGDYLSACTPVLEACNGTRYAALFLDPNQEAIDLFPDIYPLVRMGCVLGILERCHLASAGSIARHCRWIDGMQSNKNNFLAFSACLRGFLESAADAHDLFQFLPVALVESRDYLYQALHQPHKVTQEMLFGALEERLIHFAFAGRQPKGKQTPKTHVAKTNADYLRTLKEFGIVGALDLYGELCELAHPAAPSVDCFLDPGSHCYTFNANKDTRQIEDLVTRYDDDLQRLLMYSFNPPLACMAFLSRLVPGWPGPNVDALSEIGLVRNNIIFFDELRLRHGAPMHASQFLALIDAGSGARPQD